MKSIWHYGNNNGTTRPHTKAITITAPSGLPFNQEERVEDDGDEKEESPAQVTGAMNKR